MQKSRLRNIQVAAFISGLCILTAACGPNTEKAAPTNSESSTSTPEAIPSSLAPSGQEIVDAKSESRTIELASLRGQLVEPALRKIGIPDRTSIIDPNPKVIPISCNNSASSDISDVARADLVITGIYAGRKPDDEKYTLVLGVSPKQAVDAIPGLAEALPSGSGVAAKCGEQFTNEISSQAIFGTDEGPIPTLVEVALVN